MGKIIITFSSVTYAQKARKILSKVGIGAKLIKVSKNASAECTHGIEFYESSFLDAARILRNAEIEYSVYHQ